MKAPRLPLNKFPVLSLCLCFWADTILEDVQIVGGRYGDDIFSWVPSHVQDLFGEVQAIDAHVAPAAFAAGVDAAGSQDSPRLAALSPRLQGHASAGLPVEHPEEAVVRPRHNHAASWRKGEQKESDMGRKRGEGKSKLNAQGLI